MAKSPRIAIILAAGWGSRMLPATKSLAKPMLPVVNKPSIEYLVEDYVEAGIKEFIIIGKQHMEQIEEHFDRQLELEKMLEQEKKDKHLKAITKFNNIRFTFVRQGNLAGTADAVRAAIHLIPEDEAIVVSYADVLLYPRSPLIETLALYQQYPGTIIPVCPVPLAEVVHYGVAKIKQKITAQFSQIDGLVEKPQPESAPSCLAHFGPVILCPEALKLLRSLPQSEKKDSLLLPDIMTMVAQQHKAYIYESTAEVLDTGLPGGYIKAQIRYGLHDATTRAEVEAYIKQLQITNRE